MKAFAKKADWKEAEKLLAEMSTAAVAGQSIFRLGPNCGSCILSLAHPEPACIGIQSYCSSSLDELRSQWKSTPYNLQKLYHLRMQKVPHLA
jgi:hypothetical protein